MTEYETFASSSFLRTLSPKDTRQIFDIGRTCHYEAGTVLFSRGDPGDGMYVILSGAVELRVSSNLAAKTLGPSQLFGELSLFSPEQTRTASAIVSEPSLLHVFDREAFDELLRINPRAVVHMLQSAVIYLMNSEQNLVESLKARNQELSQTLDYLRRTREELDHQEVLARTDALTGLYNRRCFDIEIQRFMNRAQHGNHPMAMLIIDLDKFKEINNQYGHSAGDSVLKWVAAAIRSCVRQYDLPCRIGGDEFAVILIDISPENAVKRAQTIRDAVAREILTVTDSGNKVRASVSVGGAILDAKSTSQTLFSAADENLYLAKKKGRNAVAFFGKIQ